MDYKKNFGFVHGAGVVLAVSSLPGKYGVGSLGKAAHAFVDFLDATGQRCWQVLPLNPTSYGDSPYQSPASAAGNPYLMDLDLLAAKGLLEKQELQAHRRPAGRVDYGWLFETRYAVLRLAHSRFAPDQAYRAFVKRNAPWLEDYALFMALKTHYGHRPWTAWAPEHRDYRQAVLQREAFEGEMAFWRWCQYEFFAQWQALRDYAHSKGIRIIGDMPIYVAHDSVDVWAAPDQFLLDENYNPTAVAGCPPDGLTPEGQLWGNPIYDWQRMEAQGFGWWLKRVGEAFRLYDLLRIDHFIGFANYFSIPWGEPARNGAWKPAPGVALFRAIRREYPRAKFIVEDLGLVTDAVCDLLRDTGFPGMKMLHFAFYDRDSENLPRMYESPNCVAYVSTHDSDCSYTWWKNLSGGARRRFNRECPHNRDQQRVYDLIELAMNSRANLVMASMQDYLLLSNREGRMNEPSTVGGNWSWRLGPRYDTPKLRSRISSITARTKRSKGE